MIAAMYGHQKVTELLVEKGADVNRPDEVSDFILAYLLTTTDSVSLLFYYSWVRLH